MTVTKPGLWSFFKVYFPELYAKWLELPRAFCHKVQGPPLGPALLRGPSGNIWKVEVADVDGARCFRGAWPDFVKDHELQPGDFLVFEWDGRSSYDVVILDYSLCDKPSAFSASPAIINSTSSSVDGRCSAVELESLEVEAGEPMAIADGRSGVVELESLEVEVGEPMVAPIAVEAGGPMAPIAVEAGGTMAAIAVEAGEPMPAIAAAPYGDGSQISRKEPAMQTTPKPGPGRPRKDWAPGTEQSTNASSAVKGKRVFLSQRRSVTKDEIDKAQRAAYSFKSTHPSIVLTMRKSAVYTGYMLNIPHLFARMHLSEVTDLVLKDLEGRHWPVNLVASKTGYFMSAGWRKFCIENHLEEYDACVFELIDRKTFLVRIFRVVEEITPTLMRRIII